MPKTAFFAYPEKPEFLSASIAEAVSQVDKSRKIIVTPWKKLGIIGLKLDDLIRDRIEGSDFLIADVTYPNFNVYYEIGYAI
jgi:hypothetical protein